MTVNRPRLEAVNLRIKIDPETWEGLGSYRLDQEPDGDPVEHAAYILKDWLIGHGYILPPPDDPEMAN